MDCSINSVAFFLQSLSFCVHEYFLCVCRCKTVAALSPVVKQMLPSVFTHLCTLYPMPSPKKQWCHAKWGTQWICKNPAEYRYESWVRLVCNLDLFLMLFYLTCFTFLFSCIQNSLHLKLGRHCNADSIFILFLIIFILFYDS